MYAEIISAAAVVLVALIEAAAMRERKKAKSERERTERRAAVRERESRLSMQMMAANCALATITAKKLLGQHLNGDVKAAMDLAEEARESYETFLQDVAARQINKQ